MRRLPKRKADEPLRGYKQARLIIGETLFRGAAVHLPRYHFLGLSANGAPYGVEANAVCLRPPDGTVPHQHCACGFYAYKDGVSMGYDRRPTSMIATLTVDLYGKVIVHTLGYRAQHQRVVAAELIVPRTCAIATAWERIEITTFADLHPKYVRGVPTARCRSTATHVKHDTPVCQGHADRAAIPLDTVLDRLRTDLPTDWTMRIANEYGQDISW